MKKYVSAVLAVVMAASFAVGAAAASPEQTIWQPPEAGETYYEHYSILSAGIGRSAPGKIACEGYYYARNDVKTTMTMTLLVKDGTVWTEATSWSKSFSGKGSHTLTKTWYGYTGKSYKTQVYLEVEGADDDGVVYSNTLVL